MFPQLITMVNYKVILDAILQVLYGPQILVPLNFHFPLNQLNGDQSPTTLLFNSIIHDLLLDIQTTIQCVI